MLGQVFYSDNDSNTLSDVLKAGGLVEVLAAWREKLGHHEPHILIEDHTTHFQIHLPSRIDDASVQEVEKPSWAGRARPLITKRPDEGSLHVDMLGQGFPYDEMQAAAGSYFHRLRQLNVTERTDFFHHPEAEEFAALRKLAPHPDLRIYSYINQLRATTSYNRLLHQWYGEDIAAFRYNLACVLQSFSSCPNAVQSASQMWGKSMRMLGLRHLSSVTLLQLTNPTSGKGAHAPKANKLTICNPQGNWLCEYLKVVGLFTVGLPLTVKARSERYTSGSGRKTYVLHPMKMDLSSLEKVMQALRSTISSTTGAQLDILVVLRAIRAYIEQLEPAFDCSADTTSPPRRADSQVPVAIQAYGFEVAYYMNMGSAHTLMDLATISLPPWLGIITTGEEVRRVRALVDEHMRVIHDIRNGQGEHGYEEFALFRQYREWLLTGTADSFCDFAASYGTYVLSKLHCRQVVQPLTVTGMEKLMALTHNKQTLPPILENDGFQEIARAIRHSTITAHRRRQRDPAYPYEVRFRLGREIRDTAAYPADFLGVLSDFLTSYNKENWRIDVTGNSDPLLSSRDGEPASLGGSGYRQQVAVLRWAARTCACPESRGT